MIDTDQKKPVVYTIGKNSNHKDEAIVETQQSLLNKDNKNTESLEETKLEVVIVKPIIEIPAFEKPEKNVSDEKKSVPQSKFTGYKNGADYFLLRKTKNGFALYEENDSSENGLKFIGTIIYSENTYRLIEISGKSSVVTFEANSAFRILSDTFKGNFERLN